MITDEPTPPSPRPEGKGVSSGAASGESSNVADFPSGRVVGSPRRLSLHLLVLLVFLGLWTWKLLDPNPVPEAVSAKLQSELRYVAAKCLHACAYGFLTLLAVTLPVPTYWRWFLAALLAAHGVATEIGQTFVPGRTGTVRDVLIDWAGIGLGLLAWRLGLSRT